MGNVADVEKLLGLATPPIEDDDEDDYDYENGTLIPTERLRRPQSALGLGVVLLCSGEIAERR